MDDEREPQTLEEVIVVQRRMKADLDEARKDLHATKTSVERIETALVGQWVDDGTYREGWIQRAQREQRFFRWLGVVLTSILTALLVFAAENWWALHGANGAK